MRKILIIFMIGLLALVLAVPAFAENQAGTVNLTPFTGLYTLDGRQAMDNGPYWGLRAGYNLTKSWGLEGMYGYVTTESQAVEDKYVGVVRYGIDALYHFNPDRNLVPFVMFGLGATHTDGPNGPTAKNRGMLDYGFGVKYFFTEAVALRGDVRQAIFSEAGNSRINMEYTVGLNFALGAKKKAVETAPAAKDTTPPYVTLTHPYNGNMDVPVHRRVRIAFSEPMDAATINSKSVTLYQGKTPVPGTVVAPTSTTASLAPGSYLTPNTLYTARVTTGVRDRAGIAMENDYVWSFKTTPTAETKTIVIDKLVMLEDTHFEFDKATLTKAGKEMLNQNIKIMKDNPNLKIRVAGYTSAAGTTAYNQDLSERRAAAVKAYLIDEGGIASDRLDTIGYGETRPAVYEAKPSDLESKAAKANMRVLFEVIVQ
jgi:OmpA-OmpF porin, OOP family